MGSGVGTNMKGEPPFMLRVAVMTRKGPGADQHVLEDDPK